MIIWHQCASLSVSGTLPVPCLEWWLRNGSVWEQSSFLIKTPTENSTILTDNSGGVSGGGCQRRRNGWKVVFFPCRYFMLKGTSGPKEDVRGLKKDCECLRWIGGHILKVLTLSLHHVCPPFPGLCYFQDQGNELESGKGFFFFFFLQAYHEKW